MLDFNAPEFLVVGIVALLVIGPKDLPKAMRFVGTWVGKARRVANQFRSGLDNMVRESELAELEKKWAEENARIMREFPNEKSLPSPEYHPHMTQAELDFQDAPATTPAPEIRPDPPASASPASSVVPVTPAASQSERPTDEKPAA